jgi:hypothetical protein
MCSLVPVGISRTTSRSASASSSKAEPTKCIHRAEAMHRLPSLSRSTAPVAPNSTPRRKAPSVLTFKVPRPSGYHLTACSALIFHEGHAAAS